MPSAPTTSRNRIQPIHPGSGFAGLRDQAAVPYFDPRLPAGWDGLAFHLKIQGRLLHVELNQESIRLAVRDGAPLDVSVRGERCIAGTETLRVALETVETPEPVIFPSRTPIRPTRAATVDALATP